MKNSVKTLLCACIIWVNEIIWGTGLHIYMCVCVCTYKIHYRSYLLNVSAPPIALPSHYHHAMNPIILRPSVAYCIMTLTSPISFTNHDKSGIISSRKEMLQPVNPTIKCTKSTYSLNAIWRVRMKTRIILTTSKNRFRIFTKHPPQNFLANLSTYQFYKAFYPVCYGSQIFVSACFH
jgi:hypothetical protein